MASVTSESISRLVTLAILRASRALAVRRDRFQTSLFGVQTDARVVRLARGPMLDRVRARILNLALIRLQGNRRDAQLPRMLDMQVRQNVLLVRLVKPLPLKALQKNRSASV